MSAFQRVPPSDNVPSHVSRGRPVLGTAFRNTSTGNMGGGSLRILEKHPSPFPKCERCGSQVFIWCLNICHYNLDKCRLGEERWIWQETLQQCFEASRVAISVNSDTRGTAASLPYLGRTVAYNNSDWEALYQNIKKARRQWLMVAKVLTKAGAVLRSSSIVYKALV